VWIKQRLVLRPLKSIESIVHPLGIHVSSNDFTLTVFKKNGDSPHPAIGTAMDLAAVNKIQKAQRAQEH